MRLNVKIKQASKRKWLLDSTTIEVALKPGKVDLSIVITKFVEQQVAAYNDKEIEKQYIDFLTDDQLEDKVSTGKVSFGTIYNDNKANVKKAIKTALQAFEDGLYALSIDKKIYNKLDDIVALKEGSEVVFIKLTLLKG